MPPRRSSPRAFAAAGAEHPTLAARARDEHSYIAEVAAIAQRLALVAWQPGTALRTAPTATPNTSARFDAGSVLTISTCRPASPNATATALATVVFPTPPLPVKSTNGVPQDAH